MLELLILHFQNSVNIKYNSYNNHMEDKDKMKEY